MPGLGHCNGVSCYVGVSHLRPCHEDLQVTLLRGLIVLAPAAGRGFLFKTWIDELFSCAT
jgi:hypothetical protein